jgi:hypothetical protein
MEFAYAKQGEKNWHKDTVYTFSCVIDLEYITLKMKLIVAQ